MKIFHYEEKINWSSGQENNFSVSHNEMIIYFFVCYINNKTNYQYRPIDRFCRDRGFLLVTGFCQSLQIIWRFENFENLNKMCQSMAIHCIFEPFIKRASFSLKIYDSYNMRVLILIIYFELMKCV